MLWLVNLQRKVDEFWQTDTPRQAAGLGVTTAA
jgi:hypothetical protein